VVSFNALHRYCRATARTKDDRLERLSFPSSSLPILKGHACGILISRAPASRNQGSDPRDGLLLTQGAEGYGAPPGWMRKSRRLGGDPPRPRQGAGRGSTPLLVYNALRLLADWVLREAARTRKPTAAFAAHADQDGAIPSISPLFGHAGQAGISTDVVDGAEKRGRRRFPTETRSLRIALEHPVLDREYWEKRSSPAVHAKTGDASRAALSGAR